ncbi:hypothetical protein Pmani_015126 [Petrolisthes manimaculis]|uniref:Uncharacterized protein n=1 Tax=Petrolisthes manimaculis TaxID=1843537 RepID=A0AAE1PSK3_9EUCA|nr:hypothetical protein Pmani_015126 [Petrolisthes manimaculis]
MGEVEGVGQVGAEMKLVEEVEGERRGGEGKARERRDERKQSEVRQEQGNERRRGSNEENEHDKQRCKCNTVKQSQVIPAQSGIYQLSPAFPSNILDYSITGQRWYIMGKEENPIQIQAKITQTCLDVFGRLLVMLYTCCCQSDVSGGRGTILLHGINSKEVDNTIPLTLTLVTSTDSEDIIKNLEYWLCKYDRTR